MDGQISTGDELRLRSLQCQLDRQELLRLALENSTTDRTLRLYGRPCSLPALVQQWRRHVEEPVDAGFDKFAHRQLHGSRKRNITSLIQRLTKRISPSSKGAQLFDSICTNNDTDVDAAAAHSSESHNASLRRWTSCGSLCNDVMDPCELSYQSTNASLSQLHTSERLRGVLRRWSSCEPISSFYSEGSVLPESNDLHSNDSVAAPHTLEPHISMQRWSSCESLNTCCSVVTEHIQSWDRSQDIKSATPQTLKAHNELKCECSSCNYNKVKEAPQTTHGAHDAPLIPLQLSSSPELFQTNSTVSVSSSPALNPSEATVISTRAERESSTDTKSHYSSLGQIRRLRDYFVEKARWQTSAKCRQQASAVTGDGRDDSSALGNPRDGCNRRVATDRSAERTPTSDRRARERRKRSASLPKIFLIL